MTMNPLNRMARLSAFFIVFVACVTLQAEADEWPQWRGPQRDGVWREAGVVDAFTSPQLELKWRAEIGSGYSSPTVADGRVYVTDRMVEPEQVERVHCFDWKNGETLWSHSLSVHLSEGRVPGRTARSGPRPRRARLQPGCRWGTCSASMRRWGRCFGTRTSARSTRARCRSGASPPRRSSRATC